MRYRVLVRSFTGWQHHGDGWQRGITWDTATIEDTLNAAERESNNFIVNGTLARVYTEDYHIPEEYLR